MGAPGAEPSKGYAALESNESMETLPILIRPTAAPQAALGEVAWYQTKMARNAMTNLVLIAIWYTLSTALSLWNKLLVGREHGLFEKTPFPAPFFLSAMQFSVQHMIARMSLWSGLVRRRSDEVLTWRAWLTTVAPNGVATGLDIGLSNYSLVFITLSFYVMCKSSTPLFLLACAFAWGIEKPSWDLAGVVSVICVGLLLLVAGEVNFHAGGFALVMGASLLAGLRWTFTQILLQGHAGRGHGATGGPVEVILHLTPVMAGTLALLSLAHEQPWNSIPGTPYFSSLAHTAITLGVVLLGSIIAFVMVWTEFALIANTSALTFMVAGTFKEIVTVGAAVLFLHEPFTLVNAAGLVVLIAGVSLFNYHKYRALRQEEMRVTVLDASDSATAGQLVPQRAAPSVVLDAAVHSGDSFTGAVRRPGAGDLPKRMYSGMDASPQPSYKSVFAVSAASPIGSPDAR